MSETIHLFNAAANAWESCDAESLLVPASSDLESALQAADSLSLRIGLRAADTRALAAATEREKATVNATLREEMRAAKAAENAKATEAVLDAMVRSHEDYLDVCRRLLQAETAAARAEVAYWAARARHESLKCIAGLRRHGQ